MCVRPDEDVFKYACAVLQQKNFHILCLKMLSQRLDLSSMKFTEVSAFS